MKYLVVRNMVCSVRSEGTKIDYIKEAIILAVEKETNVEFRIHEGYVDEECVIVKYKELLELVKLWKK